MRTIVDGDLRETPRVIALTTGTLAVMACTSAGLHYLGLGWIWGVIDALPFWLAFAATAALWSGVMLAIVNIPRMVRHIAALGPAGVAALARCLAAAPGLLARAMAAALAPVIAVLRIASRAGAAAFAPVIAVLAAIARIAEPYRAGLWIFAQPLVEPVLPPLRGAISSIAWVWRLSLAPLAALWRAVSLVIGRAASLWQDLYAEWKLWRVYRAEFRGTFANYREFKWTLNARMYSDGDGSQQSDPPAPPPDPFAASCKTMGLRTDGNFSEAEFKARYRALMKEVHPDVAGPNERAAQVNAASEVIKKRKGWS